VQCRRTNCAFGATLTCCLVQKSGQNTAGGFGRLPVTARSLDFVFCGVAHEQYHAGDLQLKKETPFDR